MNKLINTDRQGRQAPGRVRKALDFYPLFIALTIDKETEGNERIHNKSVILASIEFASFIQSTDK